MRGIARGPAGADAAQRVLHAVSATTFAGIERHVVNLTRELLALGCVAELACPPGAERLREEAASAGVRVLPRSGGESRSWLADAARYVARDPPAALHVHDGGSAITGALLAPMTSASLIRTQHFVRPASVERSGWSGRASLALHRQVNRRLDGYIAVSQCVADAARERRETGQASVVVIPPAIVLPSDAAASRAKAMRARLERPVVMFAGRLEPERRLDVLLRAVPQVRRTLPDCQFVLAGSGVAEAGLRALAGELGIDAALTWTGWLADPYAVMGQAHVYVNTWPWEGFGMATAEAMALGLPVVAVDSGASSEMVDPAVTGFLVGEGDAPALAAALTRLLGDLDAAARMGEAGRRRALSLYGAERTARATLALYRALRAEVAA